MATGYEDIETLIKNQNSMLDESLQKQQDITNKQTDMNVAELEKNKEEIDKDTTKTNKALYTEYQKAKNPYGTNAEQLYSQGLGNSGYAETTQTNLYNNYQTNITNTLNSAKELKADFDFKISQARQTGDITLAQNALEIYNQKMQLLTQEYELKNNREQFLYQKEQDAQTQSNWEKEYARQQERDKVSDSQWQKNYDYQKSRDKVADSQWEKEYALSKKASASSSSRRSSSSSSSKTTSTVKSDTSKDSSSGSTVKDTSSSKTESNKLTELINNLLTNSSKKGKAFYTQSKASAKSMVYDSYKKGNITDEEAEEIFDKFGL